jgi:hypothetical protein
MNSFKRKKDGGLHQLGYLEDGDYGVYRAKYSVSLEEAANIPTPAEILANEKRHNKNRQLNRHFGEVLKQWSQLHEKAQRYHVKDAEKHKHLKNTRLILDLAKPYTINDP